jgi:glycine cleavage system T protein (aminomethyltransferase)
MNRDGCDRVSPLHSFHVAGGATFTEYAGWQMPLRYQSEVQEHLAVRSVAGLFDLSHMGEIVVAGAQAGAALDYALVGFLSALKPSGARYSLLCQPDGGVIDDLVVYRLAVDRYLVVANAANVATVADELASRCADFDATVDDQSDQYALLAVQGPKSSEILQSLVDEPLAGLRYYSSTAARVSECPALVARTGYTGEDGFEIFVHVSHAATVWQRLSTVGGCSGAVRAGLACRDTLRLEAGMPLYGHELGREVSAFDANLGNVVRFDKPGDFVGRDALLASHNAGSERRLVGLVTNGRRVPRRGHRVETMTGRDVGSVTSGAPSPTLGKPIAMAYVAAEVADLESCVNIDVRGVREVADVVTLPFYRRDR